MRQRRRNFNKQTSSRRGGWNITQVTELPMEIVVPECSYVVQEDCVKLYLRKWAATGWFKLQVHRG